MEKTITKEILRDELLSGGRAAAEVLFHRYGGMLFSYIQQFVPSRTEAEVLLVNIFSRINSRLEAAFESSLSVYCWLQLEARKIILESREQGQDYIFPRESPLGQTETQRYYLSLLEDASAEHQKVFRELFVNGRQREELALEMDKDVVYIGDILRQCMIIIRRKLA